MKLNLARILIGIVFFINLQSAVSFILFPASFAPSFELQGLVGEATLRGMGVLFVMWNVPYAVALWHPVKHRVSLYQALVMQSIGLVGESFIHSTLPVAHSLVRASIMRFIIFDGLGLIFLFLAAWFSYGLVTYSHK